MKKLIPILIAALSFAFIFASCKEEEELLMNNNPEDGVTGGATLWKLTQAITAHAREVSPERARELHEISGNLLSRVKVQA